MYFDNRILTVGLASSLLGCAHATYPSATAKTPAPLSIRDASKEELAISLIKKELEVKHLTCAEEIVLRKTRNPSVLKYTCRYRERQPDYAQIWLYEAKGRVNLKTREASLDVLEHTYAYPDPGEFSCADESTAQRLVLEPLRPWGPTASKLGTLRKAP